MNYLKQPIYRSEAWLRAVASLPCQQCGVEGRTQASHSNHRGKGMGIKTDDCLTAALCVECHREIDQGRDMSKQERRDLHDDLILRTLVQLARGGVVKAFI